MRPIWLRSTVFTFEIKCEHDVKNVRSRCQRINHSMKDAHTRAHKHTHKQTQISEENDTYLVFTGHGTVSDYYGLSKSYPERDVLTDCRLMISSEPCGGEESIGLFYRLFHLSVCACDQNLLACLHFPTIDIPLDRTNPL